MFVSFLQIVLMLSPTVSSSNEYILPSIANVKFSRIALKPGGHKSAQVCLNFYVFIIYIFFVYFILVSLF